ncbi:MAG: flagellar hook-associated protein 3 [Aquabacterium sp.]|uniref:flagellar hook-associated protein FlgL n=1 Tax=Aquabacterium sp. TaxID=1872578 RepID=UPI0012252FCE|nr:flagellar hook-associated protein FlgL [Aquabacterium sp.]TAK96297.1 MAG: flagellar hook-associated protein 3 [Aquabacterium sp.]
MRIATAYAFSQTINNLQDRQQNLATSQQQLTSGKRVNYASDDPTAAARAERALAQISRTEANQRTLDASRNVMNIAETSLGTATDLLQSARESMVAAGNGSYSDSDRQALVAKLKDIRNQLLTVANTSDGGGGYVFGGQGSSSPPFVDTTAGVVFQGQSGESLASQDDHLNLTVDGQQVWLRGKSGNGVFNTAQGTNAISNQANSGTGWISSGTVATPSQLPYPANPSPTYSLAFHVAGSTTTYDVLEDGNAIATGQPYTSGQQIAIPGKGMAVAVAGAPADGDSFNITGAQNNLNIFTSLDKTIAALQATNQKGGAVQQAVNTGMTEVDAAMSSIQGARAAVGEQLNRMDGIQTRNDSLKLAAQTEKSNAEDLDMVAAVSSFQNQQTGYQAALQSYASVQKLSLFQYING